MRHRGLAERQEVGQRIGDEQADQRARSAPASACSGTPCRAPAGWRIGKREGRLIAAGRRPVAEAVDEHDDDRQDGSSEEPDGRCRRQQQGDVVSRPALLSTPARSTRHAERSGRLEARHELGPVRIGQRRRGAELEVRQEVRRRVEDRISRMSLGSSASVVVGARIAVRLHFPRVDRGVEQEVDQGIAAVAVRRVLRDGVEIGPDLAAPWR